MRNLWSVGAAFSALFIWMVGVFAPTPAEASYVCTGLALNGQTTTSNSWALGDFENGDLSDGDCDFGHVWEAATGDSLSDAEEEALVALVFKIGVLEETGGVYVETATGAPLSSSDSAGDSGTWTYTGALTPVFYVEKYDGQYDVYTYMGADPPCDDATACSDSWNRTNSDDVGGNNPSANTSHVALYGVPEPNSAILYGIAMLFTGVAIRRRL
jgi:hypothetical protein